jgi:hypothetical protein
MNQMSTFPANQPPKKDAPPEEMPAADIKHCQILKEKLADLLDSCPEVGAAERRSVLRMVDQGRIVEAIEYLQKYFPDVLNFYL